MTENEFKALKVGDRLRNTKAGLSATVTSVDHYQGGAYMVELSTGHNIKLIDTWLLPYIKKEANNG